VALYENIINKMKEAKNEGFKYIGFFRRTYLM